MSLGMLALLQWQTETITEKAFYQHDHIAAVSRPLPGFGESQGYVVVGAALAATYTGKRCIH